MLKLSELVQEHRKVAEEEGNECFEKMQNSEVSVMEMTDDIEFKSIDNELKSANALTLFLHCNACSFCDFTNLF